MALHRPVCRLDRLCGYSWMVRDVVFIVTNLLLLVSAVFGLGMLLWHRHINRDEES